MEKWFLFSTAEGSDTSIKAFKSHDDDIFGAGGYSNVSK